MRPPRLPLLANRGGGGGREETTKSHFGQTIFFFALHLYSFNVLFGDVCVAVAVAVVVCLRSPMILRAQSNKFSEALIS